MRIIDGMRNKAAGKAAGKVYDRHVGPRTRDLHLGVLERSGWRGDRAAQEFARHGEQGLGPRGDKKAADIGATHNQIPEDGMVMHHNPIQTIFLQVEH